MQVRDYKAPEIRFSAKITQSTNINKGMMIDLDIPGVEAVVFPNDLILYDRTNREGITIRKDRMDKLIAFLMDVQDVYWR